MSSGAATHEAMSFSLDRHRDGRVTVVTVAGEIDIFTAPRLREALLERIEAGHVHLVVDVEKVTIVDSAALAVLIGAWWRVRDQRRPPGPGRCTQADPQDLPRPLPHPRFRALRHDRALRACHADTAL